MPLEGPGGRKFSELVAHHVLRDVHRDELLAVVDRDGMPHELRKNGGTPRPGADHLLLVGGIERHQLGFEVSVGKWSLLDGSAHVLPLFALARDDPLVGALVVARLETASGLAPGRDRMPAAGSLAF